MTVVDIDLGPDFLRAVLERDGVRGWNHWVEVLSEKNILCPSWSHPADEPSLVLGVDLSFSNLIGIVAPGINLEWCYMKGANLDSSILTGANLGCCPNVSFKNADLSHATFTGCDISGADFSGANQTGIQMMDCCHDESACPKGLASELLQQIRAMPASPPEDSTSAPHTAITVKARVM